MLPLLRPLIAVILGIVVSPVLDLTYVWLCLPLSVLLAFAKPPTLPLMFFLLAAGVRSNEPPVPLEPDGADVGVRIVGRLTKPPEWRGIGVYLDVELQTLDTQPSYGRARLTEFLDEPGLRSMFEALDLGSGDRVEIVVKLHRPGVYRDPGVFDFRRYLERQRVYWTGNIRNPRLITVLDRGWHGPDRIKQWIARRIEAPFAPTEDAAKSLVMGMVLGRKYGIGTRIERLYQAGGVYHLVVVSGFNLAVIAGVMFWIVRRLPCDRRTRLLLVFLAASGYAAIVEGQAPVTRAWLMLAFVIGGKLLDRGHSVGNSVAGTALIILLTDPLELEDSSFQMTFAAVIAVIGMGTPLVTWSLGWLREALNRFDDVSRDGRLDPKAADWRVARRLWCELHGMPLWVATLPWKVALTLSEIAIVSLCVELVFLIFMAESFHRMSPVSPIVNVPAALVASAVTPLGLALIVLPSPLARLAALISTELLRALEWILELALRIPGATLRVPSSPAWVWASYGLAVVAFAWAIRRRRIGFFVISAVGVVGLQGVVALADFSERAPEDTTITFIDVGQGDSILVEFPDGHRMLVDGGGVAAGRFLGLRDESSFSIGESVVSPFLWSKGFRRIDTVVLTHAHHDHIDGLLDVVENFEVGEVWLGRNSMNPQYRELLDKVMAHQIPIRWVTAGSVLTRCEAENVDLSANGGESGPPFPSWNRRGGCAKGADGMVLNDAKGDSPTHPLIGRDGASNNKDRFAEIYKDASRPLVPPRPSATPPIPGGDWGPSHAPAFQSSESSQPSQSPRSAWSVSVLHPPATWKPKKGYENNDSVVLLINGGKATALLTGDIERAIPAPAGVDVYKVPHHGSKGVKLQVQAKVRVISVGANNPFGHPHSSALPALRTDRLGAITVTLTSPPTVASALTNPGHWYKLALLLRSH